MLGGEGEHLVGLLLGAEERRTKGALVGEEAHRRDVKLSAGRSQRALTFERGQQDGDRQER